jgi:hypothetical protein
LGNGQISEPLTGETVSIFCGAGNTSCISFRIHGTGTSASPDTCSSSHLNSAAYRAECKQCHGPKVRRMLSTVLCEQMGYIVLSHNITAFLVTKYSDIPYCHTLLVPSY